MNKVKITDKITAGENLFFILGPCVIESQDIIMQIAEKIYFLSEKNNFNFIFKSSFDKANRTSINSYRGPGLEKGLRILEKVKKTFDIPLTTDIHLPEHSKPVSEVVDLIQIPAFLSRQTDLLLSAGKTMKPINVKKAQFMAPWDVIHIFSKIASTKNKKVIFTERGSSFGYNNLVVDMTSIPTIREAGFPVVIDATHSVQKPGGKGSSSGGNRTLAPYIARSGVAAGADAVFMEVHIKPEQALSDALNSIDISNLEKIINKIKNIYEALK